MSRRAFRATHEIHHPETGFIRVMLLDGQAYTAENWRAEEASRWTWDETGLRWDGRVVDGATITEREGRLNAFADSHETVNLRACVDCLQLVANAEVSEGFDPADVELHWPDPWRLGTGWFDDPDPDGDLGFSSAVCECCGNRLGGDRFKLHAIAPKTTTTTTTKET